MRLIDADALEKQLDNEKWMDNYDRDFIVDVALDEAPTVDAAPVVHGLWYQEIGDVHSTGKYRNCSICKENVFIPYFSKQGINNIDFDYCPNCGARMDGKADDNENR